MYKKFLIVSALLLGSVCVNLYAQNNQERKKIVISSSPNSTIDESIINLFIDELGKGLTKSGNYTVIQNRKESAAVLSEEVKYQDYVNEAEQVEVGKFSGADYACYVSIQKIGRNFNITCKFLVLKTGESVGQPLSMATENGEDDIIKVANAMSKELAYRKDFNQKSKEITFACEAIPSAYSSYGSQEVKEIKVFFDNKLIETAQGSEGFTIKIEDTNPGKHILKIVANQTNKGKFGQQIIDIGGTFNINTLEEEYYELYLKNSYKIQIKKEKKGKK